jgi:hypothetical protein
MTRCSIAAAIILAIERARKAANAVRLRDRRRKGQKVFRCTCHVERLINLLNEYLKPTEPTEPREYYLPDADEHSDVEIEKALTEFVDDAGRK